MIDASEFCDFEDCACGVYPEDKFSGLLTETWPNGALKFRGEYKHGRMRVGTHVCFWENGEVCEVSFWKEGWNSGTILRFRDDSSKEMEKDYGVNGARERSWTERHYGSASNLFLVRVWENDTLVSEWIEPELADAIEGLVTPIEKRKGRKSKKNR